MTLKEVQHGGFPNSDSKIVGIEPKGRKAKKADAKRAAKAEGKRQVAKKKNAPIEDSACNETQNTVSSSQIAEAIPVEAETAAKQQEHKMTITLKGLDKRNRNAIYTGAAVSLRFPIGAFPGKQAPATLEIDGLAAKVEEASKIVETKEERKARLAALPKKTLAERVAAAEKRTEALRLKLAKQAEQPAL